jgi:hypothetical protein
VPTHAVEEGAQLLRARKEEEPMRAPEPPRAGEAPGRRQSLEPGEPGEPREPGEPKFLARCLAPPVAAPQRPRLARLEEQREAE